MRLVTTACAIAGLGCVAIAGVVLAQKSPFSEPASTATGPTIAASRVAPDTDATVGFGSRFPSDSAVESSAPAESAAPIVLAQAGAAPKGSAAPAAAPPPAAAAAPPPAASAASSCPGNPNALGVARVVEIDTTGGPGFGFEHFKSHAKARSF
jgi:hypothetical protein